MASDRKLNIYNEDNQLTIINESPTVEVITIYEQGPQGPRGEKGDTIVLPTEIISGSGANNLLALYVSGGYITGSKNLSFDGSNLSISGSIYISTFSGSAVSLAGISQDNNLTNITIGSGLNLLDNTLNAVGSLTGTGSITQLAFWTASKAISGSQNLVYDYTNGRLGINNSNPQYALDVSGTIRATSFEGLFPGIISSSQQVKENLPLGTVSGSNQLTSSYDVRYELKGSNIVSGSSQVKNLLPNGTVSSSAQIAADISGSFLVTSASFSSRIVGIENKTGSFATTGSNVFFGNQTINGSILAGTFTGSAALITGDVLVEGKVTAREFFTQYISSSIIYQSGSTKFGDTQDDTHQFTGSIYLSGSLINVSHIDFSTSSYSTNAPARITWNPDFGTLDLGVVGGNVNLSWGLEVAAYVVNGEADTLVDGEVVYMSGSRGDKPKVYRASSVTELTSTKTFGVVTEHILPNQLGYVTTQGVVNGLNLSSFNPGDAVWLGTTLGTFTATKPQAPTHSVFVGIVQRANAGDGQLYVRVQNGYEIDELHNVRITNPLNGQLLTYNQAQQIWVNGNTLTGSYFVSGSIQATAFTGSSGLFNNLYITGSSNSALLVIDSPASQNIIYVSGSGNVGIGTNNPAYKLDVIGNGRFRGLGTTSATYGFQVHNSTGTNNALTVRDDGRVGIGTSAPVETLHVNGSISANWGSGLKLSEGLLSIVRGGSPNNLGIRYINTWDYYQGHVFTSTANFNSTAAVNASILSIDHGWAPNATGSTNYRPFANYYTINATAAQTGTVSGIYTNATQTNLNGALHYLINLNVNNSNKFRVDNNGIAFISGSLGIGTNAPAALLHISGSSGSGLFEIDSDSVQNIIYVSGSGNVGIGTNTPGTKFDVAGTGRFYDTITLLRSSNPAVNAYMDRSAGDFVIGHSHGSLNLYQGGTWYARFANSGVSYLINRLNVGVPSITTDIGAALGVRGSGTTAATTTFRAENSAGTSALRVLDNGVTYINSLRTNTILGDASNLTIEAGTSGNYVAFKPFLASSAFIFGLGFDDASTSSERNTIDITQGFVPTSGTAVRNFFRLSSIVSQSGTATGTSRGIYLAPVLTSAADWRSIEWTNNSGWGLFGRGTAPNFLSGSLSLASGLTVTGSVIVSGSSTFTNIGPAIFSGSVGVAGSITATQFIGDGSQLTGVATPTPIRRHDYSGSYSYCGIAPSGSSEASSVWSIDRIEVLNDGNVTITSASLVTWTGRYTHIYV